jgi:Ca-activated chloride channel family protein
MRARRCKRVGWLAVVATVLGVLSPMSRGAGLLIADGGFGGVLEIKEHAVDVVINNGIAVTKITQVFHNTEKRQVEALYTFPVPKGASVANFSMWINGKEMVGEVLEKERAREIYNSYKRKRRDPGLLEQVDYKRFEMRIFPIGPEADQKVEVTYYQELDIDNDWFSYVYPLATVTRGDMDERTTGRFAMNLEVKSAVPIVKLVSPSHAQDMVMARHEESYWQASLEMREGSLARDLVISGRLSRPKTGIDLITTKPKGEDGTFLMTLTAGEDLGKALGGMDYVFVVDISGSMANDSKLAMSKSSVSAFVEALGEQDRVELMTFNVKPTTLFDSMTAMDASTRSRAAEFLDAQSARGGTVLRPAIQTAYRYADPDRQLNVVILSDGMTEQKERSELIRLIGERPRNCRVFCVGVGNEVNRPLLEQLAEDSGGLAAFVSRGDDFARQAQAFRRKLVRPVATDLQVRFEGVDVYDLEPKVLPSLYHGVPIRLFGRYRGDGAAARVTIEGDIRGRAFKKSSALAFGADAANPEIERSWASRKVDGLVKQINRGGSKPPIVDEIVRLGETYSIVTEYTSFLVLENDNEYKRWKIERRNRSRIGRDRAAQKVRADALAAIRDRAVADVGPAVKETETLVVAQAPRRPVNTPSVATPQRNATPRRSVDFDLPSFGGGTGPVGPLFLLFGLWARRKRTRKEG